MFFFCYGNIFKLILVLVSLKNVPETRNKYRIKEKAMTAF